MSFCIRATRTVPGTSAPLYRYVFSNHSVRHRSLSTVLSNPNVSCRESRCMGSSWIQTSRRKFSLEQPNLILPENAAPPGWATSVTPHSTASDPAEFEALRCLEQGTAKLEEGDVQAAKSLYKRSAEIKRNASSLFNLGVTHYHLSVSAVKSRINQGTLTHIQRSSMKLSPLGRTR